MLIFSYSESPLENGAGKSTLIKCLTGVNNFEAGEIHIDGIQEAVKNRNTLDAQKHGISTVYQEVNLCPNLSVAENLFIGREPMTKLHTVNRKEMVKRAQKLMNEMNLPVDVTRNLDEYSLALQQMIAIARAVDMDCKVLILDEPTSSLTAAEVEALFTIVDELRAKGVSIVYISHKMDEILRISDEVTIMRDGQYIGTWASKELTTDFIITKMVGRELSNLYPHRENVPGEVVFEVKDFTSINPKSFRHVNFQVRKGEILGVAGVQELLC